MVCYNSYVFKLGVEFLSSKIAIEKRDGLDFSQPTRPTILMITVLVLVLIGAYFMFPSVAPIFLASPFLNGFILAVFVLGVLACFFQIYTIASSVSWIEGFALERPGHEISEPPRLLAALASLLKDKRSRSALNATSARSILDSVATRLDEARDITRYIINLLIFLGLLGTFYGLATTVPAVVETIRTLAPKEGQTAIEVFEGLMEGLENQLGGMGTAFASSLLGLAGSLVVGLMELFAGHGQNKFYMELEEWISSFTRLTIGSGDGEHNQGSEEIFGSVFEQTNDHIQNLQRIIENGELQRQKSDVQLDHLIDIVSKMATAGSSTAVGNSAQSALNSKSLEALVNSQNDLVNLMSGKVDENAVTDQEARTRLRNIDIQLARIHEELSAGRQDTLAEVRSDIAALSSAIIQLVDKNRKKE